MKKFDLKSMFIGIITGSLLFGGIVGANTLITGKIYLSTHSITVDGKAYKPENALLNYEGTTYVPLREFSTITGSTVNFANGTITIKKPTGTTTNTNTSTGTNPSTNTSSTSSLNGKKITIENGDTDSFYVDLKAANAKSATISITSGTAYVSISKTSVTTSGLVTVTGKKEGSATIKVTYSTGTTDIITVKVEGSSEIELNVGAYDYIDVDLDEYDADEATLSITSGSSYITLAKTSVKSNTKVKVTGKKSGEATVKVKYDSGDIVYYDFIINKSSNSSNDELDVEIDEYSKFIYYIDLDEWDADNADIIVSGDKSSISVNKTSTSSSRTLIITAKEKGEAEVEIEFYDDDNDYIDSFIIYVDVIDEDDFDLDDYYDESEKDFEIEEDDWDELKIDPDDYNADWATISVIAGYDYISVDTTYIDEETTIDIDAKDDGDAVIQVTYSTGDIEYYYVEVY